MYFVLQQWRLRRSTKNMAWSRCKIITTCSNLQRDHQVESRQRDTWCRGANPTQGRQPPGKAHHSPYTDPLALEIDQLSPQQRDQCESDPWAQPLLLHRRTGGYNSRSPGDTNFVDAARKQHHWITPEDGDGPRLLGGCESVQPKV